MAHNPEKVTPITVYVPREVWNEIKRFHAANGQPDLSDTRMIVTILRRWYNEQMAAKRTGGAGAANRRP